MNPLPGRTDHRFNPFEPHPELDDVDISGLEDIDWNNNSDAFGMYAARGFAPPKTQTPSEVRHESQQRKKQISASFNLLRAIVDRHEAKIQRRWEKKTRTQRLKLLLEAWPDMPATHRPDFAVFRKYSKQLQEAVAAQYRGCFIWPYINQEDLARPKTLPLLLNARARNHPSVFAAADGDVIQFGNLTMFLVPIFLNGYVMTLNGVTAENEYGRLVGWDEHDEAFDWMTSRKQFLPGEGLAILEAQSRLLEFLVSCCQQILHEIPAEELTSDVYPIEPEPPLKANNDPSGLASLATLAEEAPYRVPAKLDLENIDSLLAARASHAAEHIWALREDPSYFADELLEGKEHRQEILKDVDGKSHPTLKYPREKLLWARIIGSVVVESTLQLEMFLELRDQARELKALQKKWASKISPLKDLPEEYLQALLKFRHYLNQIAKGPLNQLKTAVPASPPMRNFFVRAVPESPTSSKIRLMQKPGVKMDKTTEHVLWLLRTLWEDDRTLFFCRLPVIVDELERLIQADQKARDLISPYVAFIIGDLSVVAECLRQLQVYQPWANGFENALVDREEGIKSEFAARMNTMGRILSIRDENILKVVPFGDPSDNKFDYPVGRKRNKVNVDKLRSAETHLDIFWDNMDKLLYSHAGSLKGTALGQLLSKSWTLQRTPEWIEPAAGKNDRGNEVSQHRPEVPTKPFSNLFIGPDPPSARKEVLAGGTAKSKVKSRGTPVSVPENNSEVPTDLGDARPDSQPTFLIDSRALKVFRIVFFDPTANTTPGEVAWNDFLHAMSSVGFGAQKLYGSVWHFQPTKLDVERSIQFHEPHPRGKIPFLTARRHGRRLSRAYGWFGGMFVLKDKAV